MAALFLKYLLKRNIRYQDDLVDRLLNFSEKRLARVLLLAGFGKTGVSEMSILRLSQETLAEMVGTTRSRVSFFMNRYRKLGFIHCSGGKHVRVHSSLLNVVLHEDDGFAAPAPGGGNVQGDAPEEGPSVARGQPSDADLPRGPLAWISAVGFRSSIAEALIGDATATSRVNSTTNSDCPSPDSMW